MGNDWNVDRRLVLHELERLNKVAERMDAALQAIHTDIITLKTKASVWGGVVGAAFGALSAILVGLLGRNL